MPTTPLEAEGFITGGLGSPLLSDDEEIVSQLINHRPQRVRRRRWCTQKIGGSIIAGRWRPIAIIIFVLVAWIGLFASIWSVYSCDLYIVEYPTGGLQLAITGIGTSTYQKEVKVDNNTTTQQQSHMEKVCLEYAGLNKHAEIASMKDFFPTNTSIQVYAKLAPSFYFVGMAALLVFACTLILHYPEIFTAKIDEIEEEEYPIRCMTLSIAVAGTCLVLAGIFHLLSLHGLKFNYDHSSSITATTQRPICNPEFSQCTLGKGGHWAAFAIFSSLVCGLISCIATYHIGCKRNTVQSRTIREYNL